MNRDIQRQTEQLNKKRLLRQRWHRWFSVPACVVVFVTAYALILPAVTLDTAPDTYCGQEEHIHTDECYEIPGVPEHTVIDCPVQQGLHIHTAACYGEGGALLCTEDSPQIIHHHDSFCFDSSGELLCTLPEVSEEDAPGGMVHQHTADCLTTVPAVAPEGLLCTKPEHIHTADCLDPEKWGVTAVDGEEDCGNDPYLIGRDTSLIPLTEMTGAELFALTDEELAARTQEFLSLTDEEFEGLNERMAALVRDMAPADNVAQTGAEMLRIAPKRAPAAAAIDPTTATLKVQDNIAVNGHYDLSLNGGDAQAGGHVSYRWYRTKANGTREAVARSFYRNADGTTSSNLGPSGSYLYLALDGGGVTDAVSSVEYEAVLVLNGTETSVNASITNTNYNKSVLNGSFERPQNDNDRSATQYDQGYTGLEWRTTATDNKIEIVRLTNQTRNSWRRNYSYSHYSYGSGWSYIDVWPVDGNQYAEINAEQDSALYQSVLTVPGTTMNWQLYHAQRPGSWNSKIGRDEDTMYLCIVSDTQAMQYFSNTESLRSHVKQMLGNKAVYNEDGLYIQKISDDTTWGKYTGTYTVPEGQYLTRFFFLSEEYTGGGLAGNPTLGNFLDNVWFSQELPDPSSNDGTITIQKTVRGDLTAEHRAELQSRLYFEIREGDTVLQTIPAAALGDWKQNGSDWWISKSIPISDEWVGMTVDVVECSYEMDDLSYTVTTEKSGQATTLSTNSRPEFSFVNNYRKSAATLTVEKIINGTDTSGSFPFVVSCVITDPNTGEKTTVHEEFTLTNHGVQYVANLPIGAEVTLTETKYDGYTAAVYRGGKQVSDSGTYTFIITENTELTVYNTMGVPLPETGGATPYLFIYGGLFLMLSAVVTGYILRRRYRKEDLG